MDNILIESADVINMFCRLQANTKPEIAVRSSEMGVLIYIKKENDNVTPINISRFFKITKPSVTAMINSLEKKGYLIKVRSDLDKRSLILRLTERGNELVDSTFSEYYKIIELLRDNMGEDRFNQLIESMKLANSILEKEQ